MRLHMYACELFVSLFLHPPPLFPLPSRPLSPFSLQVQFVLVRFNVVCMHLFRFSCDFREKEGAGEGEGGVRKKEEGRRKKKKKKVLTNKAKESKPALCWQIRKKRSKEEEKATHACAQLQTTAHSLAHPLLLLLLFVLMR